MEVELNVITTSTQMSLLYEAAYSGDVSMLNSLIQKLPHMLHKTSQTAFAETPLHISSLLGHLQFTKQLLSLKPNLALEVDSSRMTALHVASAEGHIRIVKELLRVNNQPCLFPDEEGRIPLHYAAMRGRTEVVKELIKAKPESLSFRDKGKSVFHLCVTYNHLETLKALVQSELAINGELLNFESFDVAGNTILHLAITLKRVEVVSYLLSIPEISEIANMRNKIGFTAQDILEQSPKDLKICEMQHMLTKAEKEGFETDQPHPPPLASTDVVPPEDEDHCIKMFKRTANLFKKVFRWIDGMLMRDNAKWVEEMRVNLSLVSTVITTITFQALTNPPGGFIQQGLVSTENEVPKNVTLPYGVLNCTTLHDGHNTTICPGDAMAASPHLHADRFEDYLACVTLSFFSSLSVTLLLVSGIFPMNNRFVIWVASIGMCITLTSLASAYVAAIDIIIPDHHLLGFKKINWKKESYAVWSSLLELIVVLITLRLFIWGVKKYLIKIFNKSRSWRKENGWRRFLFVPSRVIAIFVMLVFFSVLSCIVHFFWEIL